MVRFCGSLGWRLDAGRSAGDSFRMVQLTPPGSGCSIRFGAGVTSAAPGSARRVADRVRHRGCVRRAPRPWTPLASTLAGHGRPPAGGPLPGGGARRHGSPGPAGDGISAIVPISTVQCDRSAADRHGDHRHVGPQQRIRDLRDPPHPARCPWLRPRPGARRTEGPTAKSHGAAAASGGFWSGLVVRFVTSCPDRSRRAGQGTASVFQGRDGPAPGLTLRSVPTSQ
jgi:hypothetical protein